MAPHTSRNLLLSLAFALLAGCVSEPANDSCPDASNGAALQGSDSVRSLEDGVYTDHAYGYRLKIPACWKAEINLGFIDFTAANDSVDDPADITISIRHSPLEVPRTMAQVITDYWTHGPADSIVIHAAVMRGGVETITVDAWDTHSVSESPNRDRVRIIDFVRDGERFSVTLMANGQTPDFPKELQRIESSLTFF